MRSIIVFLCLLSVSCSNKYKDVITAAEDYQIIPKPSTLEVLKGRFLIDDNTKIVGDSSLITEGDYLAEMLSLSSGENIKFDPKSDNGNIILKIDDAITNNEGYELKVAYNEIIISGKTSKGVFYGIQTLRQLMPASIESKDGLTKELTIPAVSIKDSPRYLYRGMHLDVARHFFPVSFVKKYIDLIAMHKMNAFHWHLTEDQGWRIEIKKYPKLTEVGAWRNGTIVGHHPGTSNDQKKYGGFYTQEDIKEIVKYASERHVTVIPEIELPGHGGAAIASYPFLSCFPNEPTKIYKDMGSIKGKELQANGTPKIVYETWGVIDDVFCAGQEETFEFLENVLAEIIPLFPAQYIHIGGDECPKGNWKKCSKCQQTMVEKGLKNEHELQSYFIQRMEKYINSKGKKIIGWEEILEGGLAPNATLMSWRGTKGGITAAKQKHDVIMTPKQYCYFDYYQSKDRENEPLAIGGLTTVFQVYSYNPAPEELTQEEQKYILGVQGNVWTEYMETTDSVEYMLLPRMTALSEVVWSSEEGKNWNDFQQRLNYISKRYDVMDLNYAKHSIKKE
ncbi:beta-N-acetylhexosaminidase [Flavicella sp.]|uniref:beta-N-acetylhexosaminidase n=1 Tax=Flavicella sp. TaxID=2957742 RepID=UPI00301976B4